MALDTYAGLLAEAADWLNRDDLAASIPTFVRLAEAEFNRSLRLREQIKRATATLDEAYEDLPPDFLEAVALTISGNAPLGLVTPEQMALLDATSAPAGTPAYFALKGSQIQVHPAPAGSPSLEMMYFAKIPALATAGTNFLLSIAPDLYLYGTLAASAPFLREDERLPTWEGLYRAAFGSVTGADARAKQSGSPLVIRSKVGW